MPDIIGQSRRLEDWKIRRIEKATTDAWMHGSIEEQK
jgi:hypothetical protein